MYVGAETPKSNIRIPNATKGFSMTIAEKIEYFEERARQEREAAARSQCTEARRAHLNLALEHERAAERERARAMAMAAR